MTREEILNMEAGRELDRLIAEKITHIYNGIFHEAYLKGVLEWFFPSTNISDAWRVVKKLQEKYEVKLGKLKHGNGWYCTFIYDTCELCNFSYAETAPLAICKAALLTTLEE